MEEHEARAKWQQLSADAGRAWKAYCDVQADVTKSFQTKQGPSEDLLRQSDGLMHEADRTRNAEEAFLAAYFGK